MRFLFMQDHLEQLAIHNVDGVDLAINCNPSDNTVSFDDRGQTYFRLDIVGFFISFCALSTVGVVILSDKRLRTHPNKLIAFICLSDAFNYY